MPPFRGTPDNAKTVLCTRFLSAEGCRFGDRCNFAHGGDEIRARTGGSDAPSHRNNGDAAYGRGPPLSQPYGARGGTWGAAGEGQGPAQYSGASTHWPAQGNGGGGGGWGGSAGGGAGGGGAQGGAHAGAMAALLGPHTEAAPLALRPLEPGNHGWTQHTAPEGYCYYYNSHTGVSQWERPLALDFPLSR